MMNKFLNGLKNSTAISFIQKIIQFMIVQNKYCKEKS